MTNPEQPAGTSQPARAAGYVLLGLAGIALVIGVISLFGGSDDDPPAAQSSPPSATAPESQPGSQAPSETASSDPGTPASSATPTTGTSAPAQTTAPTTAGTPAGQGQVTDTPPPPVVTGPPVRVYNNGTISGLAARVSDDVRAAGWDVVDTANYSQGLIPTTTVYYRPGTDEEISARRLADVLQARVEPRFDGIEDAHPGIIVIATNDYKGSSGKVS